MEPILRAEQLSFQDFLYYPPLSIPEGQTVFISGKSGCGKSTLLKLFNSTLSPSSGLILYHGQDISELDTICLRKEVLLVGQNCYLFDSDIRANFREFYGYRSLPVPTDEEIKQFLSLCLADFPLDTPCSTLSGGEAQRVFLSIHLSFVPRVLMLDEPTSALDADSAYRLFHNLKTYCMAHEMTLIAVSHDAELVKQFADTIIPLTKEA